MGEKTDVNIIKFLPKYRVAEANLDAKIKSKKGKFTKEEYICYLKRHDVYTTIPDEEYKGSNVSIYHVCTIHNFRFKAQPSNVINGYPCPICNKEKVRKNNENNYKQKLIDDNIQVALDDIYEGHNKKVYHICLICSNRWKTTPAYVLKNKFPCPECAKTEVAKERLKTQEQFEQEIFGIFGENLKVIGVYNKAQKPIDIHCNICGYDWSPIASNLSSGHGCPKCRDIETSNRCRKSIDVYKESVHSLCNNIIFIDDKYIDSFMPLLHQCMLCGYKYYATPNNVLNGFGKCPLCNKSYRLTKSEYIELLNRNNKKIELLSDYKGLNKKITCMCSICNNVWTAIAYTVLNSKFNCPNCAIQERKVPILSNEEFVERVHNVFPDIELLHKFNGSNKSMDCHCKICNNYWTVKSAAKLYYNGCSICNTPKLEANTQKYLELNNIAYNHIYKYQDLRGVNGGLLSYDFYLPIYNILIECQGEQHEREVDHFGGKKQFIIQQIHDLRKRKYAKSHYIRLITIWYNQLNDIEEILDNYLNNLKLESVETTGVA